MPLSNQRKKELDQGFYSYNELTNQDKQYLRAKYRRSRDAKGRFIPSIKFRGQELPKRFQNLIRQWANQTPMKEEIRERILKGEDIENIFPGMPIEQLAKNTGLSKEFFAKSQNIEHLTKNEFQVIPEIATHLSTYLDDETENLFELRDENGNEFFDMEALEELRDEEGKIRDLLLKKLEKMNKKNKRPMEAYPIQHEIEYDAVKNKYFIDLAKSTTWITDNDNKPQDHR
tara:strand:+ start:280 stop:969 length:690 start_codon:yes stop_codon:yes gene_type:complete